MRDAISLLLPSEFSELRGGCRIARDSYEGKWSTARKSREKGRKR
jgi:hypothetical protein